MIRLVGIDGDRGAGKDMLAEVLIQQFGFTRLPFAQPLKDILYAVFELPEGSLDDRSVKDAPFVTPVELTAANILSILDELKLRGENLEAGVDEVCLSMAGTALNSPREMMQIVADDMVRRHVGYDTWVNLWAREQAKYDRVVAPDARYPNERDAITVRCGKNVLVKRPGLKNNDAHISENSHGTDKDYDAIVTNAESRQAVQSEFAMWWTHIRDKML